MQVSRSSKQHQIFGDFNASGNGNGGPGAIGFDTGFALIEDNNLIGEDNASANGNSVFDDGFAVIADNNIVGTDNAS